MRLSIKISALVIILLIMIYYLSKLALPSVTVVNQSESVILKARVELPNSGLDFGQILKKSENTIHYSLEQNDGSYQYQFALENGRLYSGKCGYVTNNEIGKRLIINVYYNKVSCE